MMREYLFRGKRLDNGEWVEGDLRHGGYFLNDPSVYICVPFADTIMNCPVDPNTVGQYTGMQDIAGKRIFEGDFVKAMLTRDCGGGEQVREETGAIGYDTIGMIGLMDYLLGVTPVWSDFFHELSLSGLVTDFSFEVIGNIHDNPELI